MDMQKLKTWIGSHQPMVMIMVCTMVLVVIFNGLTPYLADDFTYMQRNGFFDMFYREYLQYMNWGGRSVAHILVRLMLVIPKVVFNIINSGVFVLLTWLIYRHITMDDPTDHPWLYALVITSVFLVVPSFGQTMLWLTGSCNYLWTSTLILLALYPLHRYLYGHPIHHLWLWMIIALCAGWSNENSGGAAILMILLMMIIHYFKVDHQIKPYVMVLIPAIIGLTMMVMAPGNYVRAAGIDVDTSLYGLVHRAIDWLNIYIKNPQVCLVLILFMICLGLTIHHKRYGKIIWMSIAFCLSGLACSLVMVVTPVAIGFDRSQFFAMILYVISTGVLMHQLILVDGSYIKGIIGLCGVTMVLTLLNYGYAIVDIGYLYKQYLDRQSYITYQKGMGNINPVVAEYDSEFYGPYNPNHGLFDVTNNQLLDTNKDYATYYGVDTIRSTDRILHQNVYANGSAKLMNIQSFDEYMNTVMHQDQYMVFIITCDIDQSYEMFEPWMPKGVDLLNTPYMAMALNFYGYDQIQTGGSPVAQYLTIYKGDESIPVYLSSYDEAGLSDIVIDGVEYSFNNSGITIVTYDTTIGSVVDAVNFDSEHGLNDAVRYHYELGYNLQWDD